MNTILDIIQKTAAFFNERHIDRGRLHAELLIAHALGLKRMDLYLQAQRPLEERELELIRPLIRRRAKREPLQYITGETDFYKSTLICRPGGLIPRPETEELVEHTIAIWKKHSEASPKRILDLGTGSGAIAIAMATEFPEAEVIAADTSKDALSLAKENSAKNGTQDRIQCVHSDWFANIKGSFDIILSNPPYLTQAETDCAETEVKDFEPIQALIGKDEDGAGDLKIILEQAQAFAKPESFSFVALETGIAQHQDLEKFSKEKNWGHTLSLQDLQERPRFFFAGNTPIHM